jgi:surface antigen
MSIDAFIGDIAGGMGDEAKTRYMEAQAAALETGTKTAWVDENSGAHGSVESVGHVPGRSGVECRDYASILWVSNDGRLVRGEACRSAGGPWRSVSRTDPAL